MVKRGDVLVKIPLTIGLEAIVDESDYQFLMQWKWMARQRTSGRAYARRAIYVNKKQIIIQMHSQIMGTFQGLEIDHINGNSLDNRKINLRICTRQENAQGFRCMSRKKTSRFRGVIRSRKKWTCMVYKNGKTYHIGSYDIEEDAARARDKKAKEMYGKFAYLNFKDS